MKRLYICLVICSIQYFLFSQDNNSYASSIDQWVDLTKNVITFNYCDPFEGEIIKSYDYKLEHKDDFDWIVINKNGTEKKILSIKNAEWLILYVENFTEPFFIGYYSFKGLEVINYINPKNVTASSELEEKTKIYYGYNVTNLKLDSPWVEGKKDYGIGEFLLLEANGRYLYLFNGYVSYNKPYLYRYNSRIKSLKITFIEDNLKEPIIFNIEDTPNPQKLDLLGTIRDNIKIEVLDVYPGLKYQDTCLNAIIFKLF